MIEPTADTPVRLAVVLDRSGSMMAIADDIVGGFNQLLAEQRQHPGEVLVTLAQFDSEDPFEVIVDDVPLREVLDLERGQFQPRGATPLYDAVGRMISRIDAQIAGSEDATDQVVVIVTDGLENASTEFARPIVFEMIEQRRQAGWAFVFLGANQDAYASGEALGVSRANRADWDYSSEGTHRMMSNLSESMRLHRERPQAERRFTSDQFWEEIPEETWE